MSLRSPTNDEKPAFVMPARIAGIQVRKDASEDIRVNLDSSPPCWNDGIEDHCFELRETPLATFSKERTKATKNFYFYIFELRALRALRGEMFFLFCWRFCPGTLSAFTAYSHVATRCQLLVAKLEKLG